MIEGLQISIPQRMILIRVILIFSVIISIFLSFNLWGGERSFPYSPAFEESLIKPPYDYILVGLALFFWMGALVFRYHRLFIFLACLMMFFLILFDVSRLQPWVYMYGSLLVIFIFYDGRVDDSNKYTSFFIILQLIVASFYFFNGLSQLNSLFTDTSLEQIILPLKKVVSDRQFLFFKKAGAFTPYVFIFIAFGLIISPIRYIAISVALFIHFLLFLFLFPSASNQNYALWFSNLAFIFLLLFLFSGKTKQRYFSPTFLFSRPIFYPVIIVFLIMPFFNCKSQWPDFLSSNFKSGNAQSATILVEQTLYKKLPLYTRYFCVQKDSSYVFEYKAWCSHELKSDVYPSEAVFNSIYAYLTRYEGHHVKDVKMTINPKQKGLF